MLNSVDNRKRDQLMLERARHSLATGDWVSINGTSGTVVSIENGMSSYCVRIHTGFGYELQFISF